jgi:hypothetical protein
MKIVSIAFKGMAELSFMVVNDDQGTATIAQLSTADTNGLFDIKGFEADPVVDVLAYVRAENATFDRNVKDERSRR